MERAFRLTPGSAPSLPQLQSLFEERLHKSYRFLINQRQTDFVARGHAIIERFHRDHHSAFAGQHLIERRFRAKIGGFDFSGVIDRVDVGDAVRIVDYKSGAGEGRGHDFRQLHIYSLAAARSLDLSAQTVALHFLYDGALIERTPTAENLAAAEEWVAMLGPGINAGRFEPRTGEHCRSCDLFDQCRPGQAWAAGKSPA